jgi:hypothetical protein
LPGQRRWLEGFAGLDENRWVAYRGFVAARDHIDVERDELEPATDAAGLICDDEGRAGAEEQVGDNVLRLMRSRRASSSMAVRLTVEWSLRHDGRRRQIVNTGRG